VRAMNITVEWLLLRPKFGYEGGLRHGCDRSKRSSEGSSAAGRRAPIAQTKINRAFSLCSLYS
jgi:hypothetical protein